MTQMPPAGTSSPAAAMPQSKASGMAIAGMVLGILSLCTLGITAIPGLILSLAGLIKVCRSGGRLTGQGMAIAGIATSAIGLMILLVVVGISVWWCHGYCTGQPLSVHEAAAQAMVGMATLSGAADRYAADHDGRLPPAAEYPKVLYVYMDKTRGEVPTQPDRRRFAINEAVAGRRLADLVAPSQTVLFFETGEHDQVVGGRELMRPVVDGSDDYVIGFADGTVRLVSKDELDNLVWTPSGEVGI